MWETGAKSKQKCTVSKFRNCELPFHRLAVDEFTVPEANSPPYGLVLAVFFDRHFMLVWRVLFPDLIDMTGVTALEERGRSAVGWQKGPRHKFYEDRYRLLCHPIPLVQKAERGEIFAVCDGVGSAPQGMAAAQQVCDNLVKFFERDMELPATTGTIVSLLEQANNEIHAWGMIDGTDRSQGACAGTVVWLTDDRVAHVFHAGDTSALMIRDGTAQALTSLQHSADGHLANYFGRPSLALEIMTYRLEESDRILLLSDGITKSLYNQQIADIIEAHPTRTASLGALIGFARAAGSGDDATAILIDVEES